MGLAILPSKLNVDCNVVDLIDEDYCLRDSLDIINNNVKSLSTILTELTEYGNYWNEQYTLFSQTSAFWFLTVYDIMQYSAQWNSATSTVENLSADWINDFSIYYPRSLPYTSWSSISSNQITVIFPAWLKQNFLPSEYLENQRVYLFVTFYDYLTSSEAKSYEYEEYCIPEKTVFQNTFSVSYGLLYDKQGNVSNVDTKNPSFSNGRIETGLTFNCPELDLEITGKPNQGCNHHYFDGSRDPRTGGCSNFYDGCKFVENLGGFSANCVYTVDGDKTATSKNLKITSEYRFLDKATVKVLKFLYRSNGEEWLSDFVPEESFLLMTENSELISSQVGEFIEIT